jgi:hypothetical protein
MSVEEMHALEKAALRDPFLADALEGYVYTSSAEKDIEELKERLRQKNTRNKIFFLKGWNNILKIAAVFILIAGLGYLGYQLNSGRKESLLSKTINDSTKTETVIREDSIMNDVAIAPVTESKKTLLPKNNAENESHINDNKGYPKSTLKNEESLQRPSAPDIALNDENIVTGKIVDDKGKPISRAVIKDQDKNIIALSDSTGRFKLTTNDSTVTATIAVPGYAIKEKTLSEKRDELIVMEQDSKRREVYAKNSAQEMQQQKQVLNEVTVNRSASKKAVEDGPSEPVGGWNKFREYLKQNLKPVVEEEKSYKGQVALSFEINKRGKPVKIKVEQSLCSACDEEAIRLLKDGPRWKLVNNRQRVNIEFQ